MDKLEFTACPICGRPLNGQSQCACGFDSPQPGCDVADFYLKIYQFALQVQRGEVNWHPDTICKDANAQQGVRICGLRPHGGISLVRPPQRRPVAVEYGVYSSSAVYAAIVDCDYLDCFFADESSVRIVFLGKNVQKISRLDDFETNHGFSVPMAYQDVHKDNPYFAVQANVLFNKSMTELVNYPGLCADSEYRVPKTVKRIASGAFATSRNLQRLYLPKAAIVEYGTILPSTEVIRY